MASTRDGRLDRRGFLRLAGRAAAGGLAAAAGGLPQTMAAERPSGRPPNIVIVFTDDQGYQDLGCFGSPDIETPNIDRMRREGMKFTDFYVTQPVCSASRAGLLTGCYSNRVGIMGALGPRSKHGIADREMTLAEVVKQKGYATACYGKWHLGHHPQFLPTNHGFDDYFGLPYSNDMWPYHPKVMHLPMEKRLKRWPHLPLIEGTEVVNPKVGHEEQRMLTTWYAERATAFIEEHKEEPFLLYLAHSMPHVPLYVSEKFKGKSEAGLYGDVIMEIDWSVGQVLKTLETHGLERDTLVMFTSDNGPWLAYGEHAGSALPLREGKGTTFDGAVREPTVMWWPGKIPAGEVCREPVMTIDVLPTVARLVGAELPEHPIDGEDIWPLMAGEAGARSPHEALYFYWRRHLQAVRSGKWKLHFPHGYRTLKGRPGGKGGKPVRYSRGKIGLALFDLENDISESENVAEEHPEVVARLKALADRAREELGDSATQQRGKGVRGAGRLKK